MQAAGDLGTAVSVEGVPGAGGAAAARGSAGGERPAARRRVCGSPLGRPELEITVVIRRIGAATRFIAAAAAALWILLLSSHEPFMDA